ncbi:cation diffusion facilitator family transporter [Euzebya pacifica]|jgi:cobalt-zinc-cadmium efflux system protein|uniref:cation diffusion facilitator family transporter n=1 Tax=Euzebya pacifica TaxID=1608957 RepID=UPI0030FAF468
MADGHDHEHLSAATAGDAHKGKLLAATGLVGGFFVVELVGGLLTNSLALLSDAAHMFTDVLGLGMALAAIQAASIGTRNRQRTFGLYRLEILAALANAVLLFGVAIYILIEAVRRFGDPPEVLGGPLLVVAVVGLIVNLIAFALLRSAAPDSLNLEGAYLEVLADTLGSVGVIIAAVVIQLTGFALIDPIFAVCIGLFVLPRTWRLGGKALRILTQQAPPHLDVEVILADLGAVAGVADVHDLHVWTLTSGMEVASAHVLVADGHDTHTVLHAARSVLHDIHGVGHATLQVESDAHAACDDCPETW